MEIDQATGTLVELRPRIDRLAKINGHAKMAYLPGVDRVTAGRVLTVALELDDDRTPLRELAASVLSQAGKVMQQSGDRWVRLDPGHVIELLSHIREAKANVRHCDIQIGLLQAKREEIVSFLAGK